MRWMGCTDVLWMGADMDACKEKHKGKKKTYQCSKCVDGHVGMWMSVQMGVWMGMQMSV